eukprot:7736925-Heterocapsa_arctica.AAC.1
MDYLVSKSDVSAGIEDDRFGVVILDRATTRVEVHPTCGKSADVTVAALDLFWGARRRIKVRSAKLMPEL